MNDKKMSVRELARFVGVADTSVHKAINSGKITEDCIDRTNPKRPLILVDKALECWGRKFMPNYVQSKKLKEKIKGTTMAKVEETNLIQKPILTLSDLVEGDEIIISNNAEHEEGKRVEMITKARMAQLELAKARGKLVERAKVDDEFFNLGAVIRTALQGIPDKYLDNILAAGTRQEAHSILYTAITDSLESLQIKK